MTGLESPPGSRLCASKDGASLLAAGEDELASSTPITIDELFSDYIGEFGHRQIWLFSIVSLAWLPAAFATLNMAFFGKDPIREHLWQCTDATDAACSSAFQAVDPTDKFCKLEPSQWAWTHPHESVRSDLGLFCDRAWILQVTNSIFFLGFLVGVALAGVASDNYGRKRTLMGVIVLAALATAAPALAYSLTPFMFARFFQGMTVGGIGVVAFTLACEMVGASWRGILGIVSQVFWGTGVCLLPLLALAVPNWRAQCLACAASLLVMVPLFPFMPESPRWLLSQMRMEESTAVLKLIAQGNGRPMPRNKLAMPRATAGPAVTLVDTFKVPELRSRMLILMFCWFVASMAYYGVSLALEDLPGSLYLNFFLASIVEFPSYVATIVLINRLGRRLLSVVMYVLCGIACMLCAVIPSGDPGSTSATFRIITAVIGKFGMASAFAMLFVFTSELFPTVVRNAALGANSAAARIGGIAAPLVVLLAEVMRAGWLSFVVFGVTAICAGSLMLGLPETQGQPLPDTIADVVRGHHHEYTHAADQVFVIDDDEDDFNAGDEQ